MDLAFAQAVRLTASQPRAASPEVKELDARLQQAQRALAADQAQVKDAHRRDRSTERRRTFSRSPIDSISRKAQVALDQDEVDDATQDLRRAGGDPQGRMQAMIRSTTPRRAARIACAINVTPAVDDARPRSITCADCRRSIRRNAGSRRRNRRPIRWRSRSSSVTTEWRRGPRLACAIRRTRRSATTRPRRCWPRRSAAR